MFLIYAINNQVSIPKNVKQTDYREYSFYSLIFSILIFLTLTYITYIFYNLAKTVKETENFVKTTLLETAKDVIKLSKK
jgi:hypothetical protein